MAFFYRRSDGTSVDPSLGFTTLVREALMLDPEWRISVSQMSCGCRDAACGQVETQVLLAAPNGPWIRLRFDKAMPSLTADDVRAAASTERQARSSLIEDS
jgi:hypothetical protein